MNTWCCTASATSHQSTVQVYTICHANTEQNEVYSYCQDHVICFFFKCRVWFDCPKTSMTHGKHHHLQILGKLHMLEKNKWHWLAASRLALALVHPPQSQIQDPPVLFHSFSYGMSSMDKAAVWAPKPCSTMLQHPWNFWKIICKHIFTYEWSHATSKAGAPAKHWMESHQCVMAVGKLTCKTKQSSIFRTTLDTWSLVHQLIQFKKRFLLFVIQAICPHWLRTATALVLVSTCHVLPWSWNNICFLLASGTSFQVSTWWIKLSQHMPNCSSKEVGRWVHLDWSNHRTTWKQISIA